MSEPIPVAKNALAVAKPIPRTVWIGGGIAVVFFCVCAIVGISVAFNMGSVTQPSVLGKWDAVSLIPGAWEFKADGTGQNATGPFEWKMDGRSVCNIDMIGRRFQYRVDFENDKLLLTPTLQGREGSPVVLRRAK